MKWRDKSAPGANTPGASLFWERKLPVQFHCVEVERILFKN
jgi:hypothetical protein